MIGSAKTCMFQNIFEGQSFKLATFCMSNDCCRLLIYKNLKALARVFDRA